MENNSALKRMLTQEDLIKISSYINWTVEEIGLISPDISVANKSLSKDISDTFINWVYEQCIKHQFHFFKMSDDGNSMFIMNQLEITKGDDGLFSVYETKNKKSLFEPFERDRKSAPFFFYRGSSILKQYAGLFDNVFHLLKVDFLNSIDFGTLSEQKDEGLAEAIESEIINGHAYGKLKNTLFGMNFFLISKVCFKRFYNMLNPEVLKFSFKLAHQFEMTLLQYNFAAKNKDNLDELFELTPGIACLAARLNLTEISEIKKILLVNGITQQGWRWLINQKSSVVAVILTVQSIRGLCQISNDLSSSGVEKPNFLMLAKSMHYYGILGEGTQRFRVVGKPGLDQTAAKNKIRLRLIKVLFSQAELVRKKRGANLRNFIMNDIHSVMDWVNGTYGLELSGDFNWAGLVRKQNAWHHEIAMREFSFNPVYWKSIIDVKELSGFTFTALNNPQQLVEEGRKLHHCVASYANRCIDGHSRIFSVRGLNGDLATLELAKSKEGDRWSLQQIRSSWNKLPSKECSLAANDFVKSYNVIWKKMNEDERVNSLETFKADVELVNEQNLLLAA